MIDHIFIKNYKAFDRKNIPLDKFTLLIGTNSSGKSTVLEALDLFFNDKINKEVIRDKTKEVVVEVHIDDTRYRKVYSPPHFEINYLECIGDMYNINHIKFLHIPKDINNGKLLNDILSINITKKTPAEELQKTVKVFDYIDGVLGNSNYPIFKIDTKVEMNINKELHFTKEEYTKIISNITYQYLILGIDNFEDNFDTDSLKEITKFSYQALFTTKDKAIVQNFDYCVYALYKDDITKEFETIKQIVTSNKKTYLLVEGKYDVAWFESGLKLLGKNNDYRVIPCGGYGNIQFIDKQLKKENIKTLVITDGDTRFKNALKREIIELYADLDYVNMRFNTSFKSMPKSKIVFFKRISIKDDIVKKVLSSWARKNLTISSLFVKELNMILKNN